MPLDIGDQLLLSQYSAELVNGMDHVTGFSGTFRALHTGLYINYGSAVDDIHQSRLNGEFHEDKVKALRRSNTHIRQ